MERSNMCSKLKQANHSSNRSTNYARQNKGSSPWDLCNEHNMKNNIVGNSSYWRESDLAAAGFSWPPRSYTCTFCKREFRSAQALGGHMNVHRRDRARLRLSSPTVVASTKTLNLDLNPNPSLNPNPNFSSSPNLSSLFTKFPQFNSALPPICPVSEVRRLSSKGRFAVEKAGCDRVLKKGVGLDLEIGLISQSKEELDLELRLGYT